MTSFYWEFSNNLSDISKLESYLKELQTSCHLSDHLVFHMNLVLDELLTNIISYGFKDEKEHIIFVSAKVLDTQTLEICVVDDGTAFNPFLKDSPDLNQNLEDRPIGGLGIHFARKFSIKQDYKRSEGKNHVTLLFDLK